MPGVRKYWIEIDEGHIFKKKKWKFGKADWSMYNEKREAELKDFNNTEDIDECNNRLTAVVNKAANEAIPRTK